MKLIRYKGNADDVVGATELHLRGVLGFCYTLCGLTLDGDPDTAGSFEMVDAPAVTCPDCAAVIKHCRGVRIKTNKS